MDFVRISMLQLFYFIFLYGYICFVLFFNLIFLSEKKRKEKKTIPNKTSINCV